MKPETRAIHSSQIKQASTGDVIQPITLSTTFLRSEEGDYPGGYMYTRLNNPNRETLENVLAAIEFGEDACAFSSGNTAGMTVFQALKPGTHIIAPDDMYWGLRHQLQTLFAAVLEFDFVDQTNIQQIETLIKPNTGLIWVESPSNPLMKIVDISAIAELTKQHGLILVCDNTFASPYLQNPITLGADIAMHSTTKYIGGHSDVLGGALITARKNEFWETIKNLQQLGGAVPSPFDCYLLTRSLKTLAYRMRGHCENGRQLASFLNNHAKVEAVFYPGLESHPQHDIAKKQMKDFGGMLSFLIKGDGNDARMVVNKVHLFSQATSLGGVESLIEHRASVEGPGTTSPATLIRVSVGLEHIDDLIADLEQALG